MNAGEKAAAYAAKFNNKRITTMNAAVKVMVSGKDHEDRAEAVNFIFNAVAYYCKDDINDGMTLEGWIEGWIEEGDWHFKAGKLPTAKQLAADYDAR